MRCGVKLQSKNEDNQIVDSWRRNTDLRGHNNEFKKDPIQGSKIIFKWRKQTEHLF